MNDLSFCSVRTQILFLKTFNHVMVEFHSICWLSCPSPYYYAPQQYMPSANFRFLFIFTLSKRIRMRLWAFKIPLDCSSHWWLASFFRFYIVMQYMSYWNCIVLFFSCNDVGCEIINNCKKILCLASCLCILNPFHK